MRCASGGLRACLWAAVPSMMDEHVETWLTRFTDAYAPPSDPNRQPRTRWSRARAGAAHALELRTRWSCSAHTACSHLRSSRRLAEDPSSDPTPFDLYIAALYWSIMTFTSIGYGDIVPVSTVERTLCCVYMVICRGSHSALPPTPSVPSGH
jgi:hypothetical protein